MDKIYGVLRGLWNKLRELLGWNVSKESDRNKSIKNFVLTLFMAFAGKTCKVSVILPKNFNLEEHKGIYPPCSYGFESVAFKDYKALYILHLLSVIPSRNSDLITEDGFIPIHTPTLQNHMRDYKLYMDYLVNTGVLVCDEQYTPGEKSKGYKWASQYDDAGLTGAICNICDYKEDRSAISPKDLNNYPYLFYWYSQNKLNIDPRAQTYADAVFTSKMHDSTHASWDWNKDKSQYKHPLTQYLAVMRNITRIENHKYDPHLDNNIHRLHSVLTNIQKDFRNFITYDGQELVCVDIKNCQPYLFCLILNPDFWKCDSDLPLSLYKLPENIQLLFVSSLLQKNIQNFFAKLTSTDTAEYTKLVSSGNIYEEIMKIANEQISDDGRQIERIERKDAKVLMFYLLFSSNRGQHNDPKIRQIKSIFTARYPKIIELFQIIKREYSDCPMDNPHSRLSCLLQAIESSIILHKCCKRIWDEKNHSVPIFTIHDSIVSTQEYSSYIQQVMREELESYIGIQPPLSEEKWSIATLNQENRAVNS